jgi:hypothetical protein
LSELTLAKDIEYQENFSSHPSRFFFTFLARKKIWKTFPNFFAYYGCEKEIWEVERETVEYQSMSWRYITQEMQVNKL